MFGLSDSLLPQLPWWPFRALGLDDFPPPIEPQPKRVRVLQNVLILPGATGLHDCAGRPISGSNLERGSPHTVEYPYGRPVAVDPCAAFATAVEVGDSVFLAYSDLRPFGHMLTEGAGWLWPFLDPDVSPLAGGDPAMPLFAVDRAGDPRSIDALCRSLGLPRGQVQSTSSMTRPVSCRRVFLPVPSMINRRWIAGHHFDAVQRLVDRVHGRSIADREAVLHAALDSDRAARIYLSRSALGPGHRLLHGEEELEAELLRRSWRIIHPQHLPIGEQLLVLARAGTIAGEAGSAFHAIAYLGRGFARKTVVMLGVRGMHRDPRIGNFVAQFREQPVDFRHLGCLGFRPRAGARGDAAPALVDRRFLATPRAVADRLDCIAAGKE